MAICPVCTAAICAGVGLSRWLKVDDVISGIWIGGLVASSFGWFLNWLKKRKLFSKIPTWIIGFLFYLVTIAPLFFTKIIGNPQNKICFFNKIFIDRIIFGIIIGSIAFFLSVRINKRHYFPFQKVVMPITFFIIASLFFYLSK